MSNQPSGVANDGSRPKSAFPNTPSWLPASTVAKPPPPPPPPATTEPQQAEQVSVPTRDWSNSSWASSSWDKNGRVGTTATGNGDQVIVPDHRRLCNCRCRVELFQSRRHLLLTGNVTIPIPCRTRSSFETSNRHPGPRKTDWRARTSQTFVTELTRKGLDSTISVSVVYRTGSFRAWFL